MNGIAEILSTGRAPFGKCGRPALDPSSVYVKAPKGLSAVENEPIYKHGPARGAKRIAQYFGMNTSKIKEVWSRPPVAILLAFLMLTLPLKAVQINNGNTLVDGQNVHAADLNNMINNATLASGCITAQSLNTSPQYNDYFLGYSPTIPGLYKATLLTAFFQNSQRITLLSAGTPVYTNADYFDFYSANSTNLANITFSNLVLDIAQNINPVSYLNFYPTNSAGTNYQLLPNWTGSLSIFNTNNPLYDLGWTTNGVAKQVAWSNVLVAAAADLGTNVFIPYAYNLTFKPWTVYGTNTGFYTNLWGQTTNFPITATYQFGNTNQITISTNDTIPISSTLQQTNTSFTVGALLSYLSAVNALPAYTQARISFGAPVGFGLTPSVDVGNNCLQALASFTNYVTTNVPICVSFLTTNLASLPVTTPQIITNTPYWILAYASSISNSFRVFGAFTNAYLGSTNYIQVNSGGTAGKTNFVNYVPVFTSYNADIIQLSTGSSPATEQKGQYSVYFRTPSTTTNYYVSGSVQSQSTGSQYQGIVTVDSSGTITTTNIWIDTQRTDSGNGYDTYPRSYVLISPQ